MSLTGKLEANVDIKASAAAFHGVFGSGPHQTTTASPDKILGCDLHEGDWGNSGSVVNWNYVHGFDLPSIDGKAKISKAKVDAVDDVNNSTTYSIFEGDLMDEHKSFVATVQAIPKGDGGSGALVQWTFEYEKLNGDVPDPDSLLEFAIHLTKDVDAHLCQDKSA